MATVLALGASGDTVGQGSAFIVRDDGVLVTNFHVLRGASSAIVLLTSREQFAGVQVL
jgi:S1-C subfamily serine protease